MELQDLSVRICLYMPAFPSHHQKVFSVMLSGADPQGSNHDLKLEVLTGTARDLHMRPADLPFVITETHSK